MTTLCWRIVLNQKDPKVCDKRIVRMKGIIMAMNTLILILILTGNVFAAEPQLINRQFIGTADPNHPFVLIDTYEPIIMRYREVSEPNGAWDIWWEKPNMKTYIMDSAAALKFVASDPTKFYRLYTLSKFWIPIPPEPVHYLVYITKTGTKYHTSTCTAVRSSWAVDLQDAIKKGLTSCKICNPNGPEPPKIVAPVEYHTPSEPNLADILKDVNDIELKEAIKKLMEIEK